MHELLFVSCYVHAGHELISKRLHTLAQLIASLPPIGRRGTEQGGCIYKKVVA